ncbi:MAG: serine/threonine protein kinase [Myxococcales bacterium]
MQARFGRYELLKRLAGGGMGEVYLARQRGLGGFQKLLVIKTLLPHLCEDEEFIAMFTDEARLSAQLIHPNIGQVFEFDEIGGTYYIAMEYLRGEDLRRLFRACHEQGRPRPVPLICRIVADAAAGLAFAHSLRDAGGRPYGIVHRDISPQNILVTLDGGVKIIDFGIAKAAGRAQHTRTGALKGKCSYMSPEQASGEPVDARADIFALGIVLHELLTGRRLFKAEDDVQTLARVRECRVPAPSEIDPGIDPGLDPIVLKALEREPARRYASAQELRLALEDWLIEGRRSASSAHLAEFLKVIYADRLEREAGEATAELPTPATRRTPTGSARASGTGSPVRTGSAPHPAGRRGATVVAAIAAAVIAVALVAFFAARPPALPPAAATVAVQSTPEEKPPLRNVTVVLKTEPPGAAIAERGTLLGTSPHVWTATPGEHQLTFQLAGYRDATQDFVADRDGQQILVRLPPLRPARRVVKDPAIKAER